MENIEKINKRIIQLVLECESCSQFKHCNKNPFFCDTNRKSIHRYRRPLKKKVIT